MKPFDIHCLSSSKSEQCGKTTSFLPVSKYIKRSEACTNHTVQALCSVRERKLICMPSFEEPGEGLLLFCCLSVGHSTNGFRSFSKQRVIYWYERHTYLSYRLGYVQTIFELQKFQLYAVSVHFTLRLRGAQVFYKHLLFVLHSFFILEIKMKIFGLITIRIEWQFHR